MTTKPFIPFDQRPSKLKFIYAGFSKCRTKTFTAACRQLGFKVYDFNEHQIYNHQGWLKVLDPKYSVDERYEIIYEMYKDVEIAVAQPIYQYWKEFTIVFPKCKVIFYEREIKSWAKSGFNQLKILSEQNKIPMEISNFYLRLFSPTVYQCTLYFKRMAQYNLEQNFYGFYTLLHGRFKVDPFYIERNYRKHNADVRQNCPKDRFFELTKEGFLKFFSFYSRLNLNLNFKQKTNILTQLQL